MFRLNRRGKRRTAQAFCILSVRADFYISSANSKQIRRVAERVFDCLKKREKTIDNPIVLVYYVDSTPIHKYTKG